MEFKIGDTVKFNSYKNFEGIIVSIRYEKFHTINLKFSNRLYPYYLEKKDMTPVKMLLLEKNNQNIAIRKRRLI
jgi:hypothetical protein